MSIENVSTDTLIREMESLAVGIVDPVYQLALNEFIRRFKIAKAAIEQIVDPKPQTLDEPIKMVIPEGVDEKALMEMIRNAPIQILPAQECEVGDVVYQTDGVRIYESKIKNVLYDVGHFAFDKDAIGKSVFLTYEEAEAALPQPPKGE